MSVRTRWIGLALLIAGVAAGCKRATPVVRRERSATARVQMPTPPGPKESAVFPNDLRGLEDSRSVAFVCDASNAMGPKMDRVRRSLREAISTLRPDQQFSVTFFQIGAPAALSQTLLPATDANKERAQQFLLDVGATTTTDAVAGLDLVLRQHPQELFLIADSDFPDSEAVLKEIDELDPHYSIRINTIAYAGGPNPYVKFYNVLRWIAEQSGGVYKRVNLDGTGDYTENPVIDDSSPFPSYSDNPASNDYLRPSTVALVCDASDSMAPKLGSLVEALYETIDKMDDDQQFSITIMRPDRPMCLKMAKATPANKRLAKAFLQTVRPGGTTDPIPALQVAFAQHPDLIWLFADRDFPDDAKVMDTVHRLEHGGGPRIGTIAVVGPDPDDHDPNMIQLLKQIASETEGTFRPLYFVEGQAMPELGAVPATGR